MREIKFRAWVLTRKEMGPVETLSLTLPPELVTHDVPSVSVVLRVRPEDGMPNYHKVAFAFPTSTVVLMQYTNLKDKNGKEIYEGDVVRVQFNGWVETQKITWQRSGWSANDPWNALDFPCQERIEVVGNIYENPELLPKGDA